MDCNLSSVLLCQGVADNPISLVYYWKNFCTEYFVHWCQNSVPYGLLVDSSKGAIGLIRKSSVSLLRSLEDMELLIYGMYFIHSFPVHFFLDVVPTSPSSSKNGLIARVLI